MQHLLDGKERREKTFDCTIIRHGLAHIGLDMYSRCTNINNNMDAHTLHVICTQRCSV